MSDSISKILISSYSDDIIIVDGELNFEDTVFNFANRIIEDMPINKQKKLFGQEYTDSEEMYSYLICHVNDLREELENTIQK